MNHKFELHLSPTWQPLTEKKKVKPEGNDNLQKT